MTLLDPSALWLLGLAPLLLLLARWRRPSRLVSVPSLELWRSREGEPALRLVIARVRRSLLLLLQVLVLALVALALGRPLVTLGGGGREVALVVDTSASMAARDAGGERRLERAREAIERELDRLGRRDRVTLVEASGRPRIAARCGRDRGRLRRELAALEATAAPADLDAALALGLGVTGAEGSVILVTDAAAGVLAEAGAGRRGIRVVPVGEPVPNLAITAIELEPSRLSRFDQDLFLQVSSFQEAGGAVPLAVRAGGRRLVERELRLAPGERRAVVVEGIALDGGVLAAELGVEDALDLDDRAQAVLRERRPVDVLLVTSGSRYLEAALAADPRLALEVVPPERLDAALARRAELTVLDGLEVPAGAGGCLAVARVAGEVAGGRLRPAAVEPDHPLLRGVRLPELPAGALATLQPGPRERVIAEAGGRPLIVARDDPEGRVVRIGVDPEASRWALDLSFPVLVSNAVGWLSPAGPRERRELRGGEVLERRVTGTEGIEVLGPDGRPRDHRVVDGRVLVADTLQPGVYSLRTGGVVERFAVGLLDARESDLREPPAPGGDTTTVRAGRGAWPAHRPLLLAALLVAAAEWGLYRRRQAAGVR